MMLMLLLLLHVDANAGRNWNHKCFSFQFTIDVYSVFCVLVCDATNTFSVFNNKIYKHIHRLHSSRAFIHKYKYGMQYAANQTPVWQIETHAFYILL